MAEKSKGVPGAEPGHIEDIQATELLREDHRKLLDLFDEFERTEEASAKRRLVEKALVELTIHSQLEEQLFYPTARRETDDPAPLDEAAEEHHVAEILVAELASMRPSEARYDAKFTVLAEAVRRHIEEEELELMPLVEQSGLDLESLGQEMSELRLRLAEEVTLESIREEAGHEAPFSSRRGRTASGGARGAGSRRAGRSGQRASAA